jgi:GNAT superfamily N-acetyltransferase
MPQSILDVIKIKRNPSAASEDHPIALTAFLGASKLYCAAIHIKPVDKEALPAVADQNTQYYVPTSVFIAKQYRGHGLLRLLYLAARKEAKSLGGCLCRDWTLSDSPAAVIWPKLVATGEAEILGYDEAYPDTPFTAMV